MFDVLGRITQLRNERNWSVYKVAKEAGIPQSTIATWYLKNRCPSVEDIEKISAAFDLTLSEFFSDLYMASLETPLALKRKASELSIEELAEQAKIPVEILRAYEQGTSDILKAQYRVVKALADALGCEMKEIVGE